MELVAIGVSAFALAISVLAWRETRRQAVAAERAIDLAERQHSDDQLAGRAAVVTAHTERAGDPVLVIRNGGRSVARGVAVEIEVPLGDRGAPPIVDLDPFPCDLAPGAGVVVGLMLMFGTADRLQVRVTWTDDLGPHEFTGVLPVP